MVDGKSNETTAIPKLLELIDIKGTVITMDAIVIDPREILQLSVQHLSNSLTIITVLAIKARLQIFLKTERFCHGVSD